MDKTTGSMFLVDFENTRRLREWGAHKTIVDWPYGGGEWQPSSELFCCR